jgi:beta-xylosidase
MLEDNGVAQGGLIDTPDGRWFAYLFRDYGSVGRIPYLVPVEWKEGWPELGEKGKVPDTLDLPPNRSLIPSIVSSDDFKRDTTGDLDFSLVWQWNHNPVEELWSLSERPGHLRLKTDRKDTSFYQVRNMLTQRTIGPSSSGSVRVGLEKIREGDYVGLAMLQREFGFIGVTKKHGAYHIVIVDAENGKMKALSRLDLNQKEVHLKASGNFQDRTDKAKFFYSLDGNDWMEMGSELKMSYTLPHFMGYRFALFYFSTEYPGGYADFDYFHVEN